MNKILFTGLTLLFLLGLSGCFSGPTMQMFKDGNIYYPNWSKYDNCQSSGSYAICYKDEQEVEKLYPFSEKQISYLRYEKQQEKQAKKKNFGQGLIA